MLYLFIAALMTFVSAYRNKIEPFSFDIRKYEYPLEYLKFGATVALRKHIKLLPRVANRFGGLWLSQPVETNQYEVVYKVNVKTEANTNERASRQGTRNSDRKTIYRDIEGYVMWALNSPPNPKEMEHDFGYKPNFNGVGVFVLKHDGIWRIQAIVNQGLGGLTVDVAVSNLTTSDNHCILREFRGGRLDVKMELTEDGRLYVSHNMLGDSDSWTPCINGKKFKSLTRRHWIGVSAGNPDTSNVNEIDVESIDFFNLNRQFYQHQEDIVEGQEYYARDASGYSGATQYPKSAKLETIKMGDVAVDIFEQRRIRRDALKELRNKALFIVKEDDDINEVIFKLFEQMRSLNIDLERNIKFQDNKLHAIEEFEDVVHTKEQYQHIVSKISELDGILVNASQKFAHMTREAKRVIDEAKIMSDVRKERHGVSDNAVKTNHHRELPRHLTQRINTVDNDFASLRDSVANLQKRTKAAVQDLWKSKEKVYEMRHKASISGNKNVFDKIKDSHEKRQKMIFGVRGSGMYQDYILEDLQSHVNKRLQKLGSIIESRQQMEAWLTAILTLLAIGSVTFTWLRMQKLLGKNAFMGGPSRSANVAPDAFDQTI